MNKEELLVHLVNLHEHPPEGDEEDWHMCADELLLEYINDKDITNAFMNIEKWYA